MDDSSDFLHPPRTAQAHVGSHGTTQQSQPVVAQEQSTNIGGLVSPVIPGIPDASGLQSPGFDVSSGVFPTAVPSHADIHGPSTPKQLIVGVFSVWIG